jgi:glutaredoxin 3
MTRIVLYTTPFCGYCRATRRLLADKGLAFEEIDVAFDDEKRGEMIGRTAGMRSVPQIFIDGRHVGGHAELAALEREGRLDAVIANDPALLAGAEET